MLFFGFKAKMWMTFGLGLYFFALYIFVIWLASQFIDIKTGVDLLFIVYENPLVFIQIALLLVSCFPLFIYFIRMIIKYLFITRSKNN